MTTVIALLHLMITAIALLHSMTIVAIIVIIIKLFKPLLFPFESSFLPLIISIV
jgi:uncharacterized membrane protein YdfJ with MMPL/SSD domain